MTRLLSFLTHVLPALLLLVYLLMTEPPSVLLLFASALAAHEWGHLCAFSLLGIGASRLRFEGAGLRLFPDVPLLPHEEGAVALAGPLSNLLFALLGLRFGRGPFFLLFSAVHLLFAFGNLLPFGGCDGERLLSLLLSRFPPKIREGVLSSVSLFSLSFLFFLSLFLYYLTGNGICGVIFSLFFLLEDKKMCANVF